MLKKWQREWRRGLTRFARAYTGGEEGRRVEEVGGVQAAGDVEEGRGRHRRRRQRQGRRGHRLVPRRPAGRGRGAPQHDREVRARERERSGPRVRRRLDAPGRRGGHRGRPKTKVTARDRSNPRRGAATTGRACGGVASCTSGLAGTVEEGDEVGEEEVEGTRGALDFVWTELHGGYIALESLTVDRSKLVVFDWRRALPWPASRRDDGANTHQ